MYYAFIDGIIQEINDQFVLQESPYTAQKLIPAQLPRMTSQDIQTIKDAFSHDTDIMAFDMDCKRWRAWWGNPTVTGNQTPSTLSEALDNADPALFPNIRFDLTVSSEYCRKMAP